MAKGNSTLLNWINEEISDFAKEKFFHKDYEETLSTVFGKNASIDDFVIEAEEWIGTD